jgi:hypothetical protein
MADNTQLNPGAGGDIAAADDIAGVKYQRVKLTLGANGVNDGDLSDANPMPVAGSLSVSNFPAQTGLTDAQLRASAVPVSGDLTVSNFPAQTGLTDAQLRASAVPVSGALTVSNFPAQTGLTNAELRAEALPVNATGELIEAIEAMRMAIASLTRSIGQSMPDTAGRLRVNVETGAVNVGSGTITTVTTLTNQAQIGGLAATEHIPSLMRLGADSVRRNITTS